MDDNALKLHDTIVTEADPLKLDLEDQEFIDVIAQYRQGFDQFYGAKHLIDRQNKNLDYYRGIQLNPEEIPTYQKPFMENVIYEGIRRIKPIATSRMPDLTVKPGSNDPDSKKNAQTLTDVFNTDIKKRETRKLLGMAHVHEQLFFYAVIKARWNTELGTDGNYEFLNVYPTNVWWDWNCKTNNADDMRFIGEDAEYTLKEICMMFPKAKAELLEYLGLQYPGRDLTSEKGMASTYKISEVWFHWYKETTINGESKWEKIQAVVWKYGNCVLGKMRNPYFDYEGRLHLFTKEMKEKGLPSESDLYDMLFNQDGNQADTIYYNYFKNPRKPYFFMVYESLGRDPIDETNRVEQILYFQDHINKEGTQIIQMNEQSAGKLMVNSDALDKDTVKTIDWHNTRQVISVNGEDINKAYAHISMPPAPAQLYQSKSENRSIAFEMLGVNATTRGVKEGDQTLGEAQLFKEADYGFIDDLVEETINECAEWMAQWSMQFIRVFYTKAHMVDAAGVDGESLYLSLTQDTVTDGMSVVVSASGVDKLMRKRMAIQNAKVAPGDYLGYFQDTDQDNPKERARRAWLSVNAPMQYFQEFLAPEGTAPGVPGPVQLPPGMPPTGQPPLPGQPPMGGLPTPQIMATQGQQPQQIASGGGNPFTQNTDPLGLFT